MQEGKIATIVIVLCIVLGVGTVGYMHIEGMRALDALYMTSITVTTVGFEEVEPLSDAGRIFTIFMMFTGIGTVVYSISVLGSWFVENAARRARFHHHRVDDVNLVEEEGKTAAIIDFPGSKDHLMLRTYVVKKNSAIANKTKMDILKAKSVVVLAVQDKEGNYLLDVPFSQKIKAGDNIILLGPRDHLNFRH